jgi:DNA topoisomerase-1
MGKPLVIVESPAKAKTISRYLGDDFRVEASIGHVRDLPQSAADIPEEFKGQAWSRLGVDVDHDFKPIYVVPDEKREVISKLKALLKDASELYLATDEDREGESISWHLLELLKPRVPVKRMVFHEITASAIRQAVKDTRAVDMPLVDAQETRRVLDRLYGYEVSPVLWKKVTRGLSAGRVQSVATRILVERERERMAFRAQGYWDIDAQCTTSPPFTAGINVVDGKRLATGKDFDEQGKLKKPELLVLDEAGARGLAQRLEGLPLKVDGVEEKPFRSSPKPPFMTSSMQQEAGRKLRLSAQQVMRLAQGLYERGYITYMRTDSTSLSATALEAARKQVRELYGANFVPAESRQYVNKVKNAQEAHEAIRPAGESFRTPDSLKEELRADEMRLYELIWKRTLASQMVDASGRTLTMRLVGTSKTNEKVEFSASGRTILFPGYLRAYVESTDDGDGKGEAEEAALPDLHTGDVVPVGLFEPKGHTTQAPARYTEASLVKRLEELGVGRPSTYASIMGTIQDRGYAWKKGTALVPSWTAFAVINLLEKHFPQLVDYRFTALMEDDLDSIASQNLERVPWLKKFYFGNGKDIGLKGLVSQNLEGIDAAAINSIPLGVDNGVPVVAKPGRYGPYLKRGEDTCPLPDGLAPDELTLEKAVELLNAPGGDKPIGVDPASGLEVFARAGRFGPYVQLGPVTDGGERPKTASLFKTMNLNTLTLEDALQLLTIPRTLGNHPDTGEPVTAHNGKFGPYLKSGDKTANMGVEAESKLLSIGLDEAVHILAQPKVFRGRGAPKAPLKEFGPDPVSGKAVVAKEGRFGIYVTDGETNASLRRGERLEEVTIERAAELLAERREREAQGGGKKPKRGRGGKAAKAPKSAAPKAEAANVDAEPKAKPGKDKAPKKASKAVASGKKAPKSKAAKTVKAEAPAPAAKAKPKTVTRKAKG